MGGEKENMELVFLLDRSASMAGLEKDTINGFNSVLKKQKEYEGGIKVTIVLFDDNLEELYFRSDIKEIHKMTDKEYFIGGCTALLDAMGKIIHKMIVSQRREGANNVIAVIITDGLENASHEYTYDSVKKMVERQKNAGWEFLFLGANMDAVSEAANLGISSNRAVTFCNDSKGVALSYEIVGETLCAMRRASAGAEPMGSSWKEGIERDFARRALLKDIRFL